ncbi:glycosyl hydrolase [Naasia aerilata]|uniref:Glycoside hydrolase n=1 Tax=Naasia aerilata TaxID=1162966 RepID=A0ABM8G8H3_9MICO|nr:glycosyl hydrolase [Naasia aerilata]BDZ44467.1 hypothetical protein GCM10025866_03760 [Naasia aerilata]
MVDRDLWRSFLTPPAEARPRVWWHWMNGNIDEEGIALDIEWMKRVGIGGAQVFEGGMNAPQLVPERLVFQSEGWRKAMRFAAERAGELGLELTIATSAGWSAAGGPWVAEADAMKKVVWSDVVLHGGGPIATTLPELPSVAGLYQDVTRPGAVDDGSGFARTTRVLAVPAGPGPLAPAEILTSSPVDSTRPLTDGRFGPAVVLPRDMTDGSAEWIAYRFDEPVTVRSVTVGLPARRGFGAPPAVDATLEVSEDGETYRAVAELPGSASPVRSRSFPPITGRWFRLVLTGGPAAATVPPMAPGVLPLPFPPPAPETLVSELALWSDGRISAAEEKAGFAAAADYYALASPDGGAAIDPAAVVDVTDLTDETGRLAWEAPPGEWRILRFGYSLTGHTNGPAPAEATGLEVDKLDAERVERYLRTWLQMYDETVGAELLGSRGIRALLSDSIESGPQNWSDGLLDEFAQRRGYSAVPWLPALAGFTVGSAAESDRFLWDWRQTIAEVFAESFYGTIARVAHERGLTYYAEALEDHRPQLGDDMQMRSHADVPMGAMWTKEEGRDFKATYVADLRGASSVAHVYGKAFTGAESMSAFGHPYAYAPRHLKPVVDLELALGVTRFCIHTSPHQPASMRPPGISLTPHLGQTFTRHETWAEQSGAWIDYLARSSFLLNVGVPVADVAYFYGEEGPLTAVFGDRLPDEVPDGFAFDFVGANGLLTAIDVTEDGGLVSRGRAAYRLLYLGGTARWMTLAVLRRLAELIAGGAVVVGERPLGSPSLADDDAEFAALVERLWGTPSAESPEVGRWRVQETTLAAALAAESLEPDWRSDSGPLAVVHRRQDDIDVYFVSNPSAQELATTLSVRATGARVEWWDAVAGRRHALAGVQAAGRTEVEITLPAHGAGFVVLGNTPAGGALPDASWSLERSEIARLERDWSVAFSPAAGPDVAPLTLAGLGPFTAADGAPALFSGTAVWSTEFDLTSEAADAEGRIVLSLGDVLELATVSVNGSPTTPVWTEPFEVDITGLVRPGRNRLEVAVTNTWANRLIADAAAPEQATTQLTGPVFEADAVVPAWGLGGPVTLNMEVIRHIASHHEE